MGAKGGSGQGTDVVTGTSALVVVVVTTVTEESTELDDDSLLDDFSPRDFFFVGFNPVSTLTTVGTG